MTDGSAPNQRVFDGGHVELHADQIEKRLNEVWKAAAAECRGETPPTRLCLSNMVVIADAGCRPEAERLANEIASGYPSRVFLMVIDELQGAYSAFVRTACHRDKDAGTLRCFEVVELIVDVSRIQYLPGALRSLLIGSVPVVTVDFRDYQSTPLLDQTVLALSDYYYVNAEVVPSGPLKRRYLPLRWYRTLAIRELLGEMFGRLNAVDCRSFPVRCQIQSLGRIDSYGDLLCGWLLARLKIDRPEQRGNRIIAGYLEYSLVVETGADLPESDCIRMEFNDGSVGVIRRCGTTATGEPIYEVEHRGWKTERSSIAMALSNYVVSAIHDASEFAEYASVVDALERLNVGAE